MQTILITLFAYLISSTGLFGIFRKSGQKPVMAFVPFYNYYLWLKLIKRPWWWIFLLMIPSVNYIMFGIMSYLLAHSFRRNKNAEMLFSVLAVPFYLLFLGFGKETKYFGPPDPSKQKPSASKEWLDAIIFAVVVATIVRTFFIEAFTIPTSSLEKTLLVGDYLFVSKMAYGAKMPNTPIAFPFAHHTLPFTKSVKSYMEYIKFPYFRLPGFGKVKQNDLVVFNYPDGDTVAENFQAQSYYQIIRDEAMYFMNEDRNYGRATRSEKEYMSLAWQYVNTPTNVYHYQDLSHKNPLQFGKIIARPPDKRENYVKRCVAIPGDKLEIKSGILYINGKPGYASEKLQVVHEITLKKSYANEITEEFLDKMDIYTESVLENYQYHTYADTLTGNLHKFMHMSFETADKFRKFNFVESVHPVYEQPGQMEPSIYPHHLSYKWNKDNFGPLVLPKKGLTVKLDTSNILLYDRIITAYELNKLEVVNGKIYINGTETSSYTFSMGYYFMMGDNRHNSADSRCWGMVPEDHIVGRPVFVWMSIKDPTKNPVSGKFSIKNTFSSNGKYRWDRFFSFVGDEGVSKSYLIYFLIIIAGIYGVSFARRRFAKKGK